MKNVLVFIVFIIVLAIIFVFVPVVKEVESFGTTGVEQKPEVKYARVSLLSHFFKNEDGKYFDTQAQEFIKKYNL
jgi:hypothetical protein